MKITIDVTDMDFAMLEKLGCQDHGCKFKAPRGMATNGGKCYCLSALTPYQELRFATILGKVYKQAKEQKDETERI